MTPLQKSLTGADLKEAAQILAAKGRKGDTILAHINPWEYKLLDIVTAAMPGDEGGSINPDTGLPEFEDGDGSGDADGEGTPGNSDGVGDGSGDADGEGTPGNTGGIGDGSGDVGGEGTPGNTGDPSVDADDAAGIAGFSGLGYGLVGPPIGRPDPMSGRGHKMGFGTGLGRSVGLFGLTENFNSPPMGKVGVQTAGYGWGQALGRGLGLATSPGLAIAGLALGAISDSGRTTTNGPSGLPGPASDDQPDHDGGPTPLQSFLLRSRA